ncbi:MAG: class I SAM-dependent methyltransferase [Thermoleophilaceae bacterium]
MRRPRELPFFDGQFDVVLAQLVMSPLSDADAGVSEMRRVARPGRWWPPASGSSAPG